jgi:hypothetical protein
MDTHTQGAGLSRDAYRHVIFTLRNAMPAVPDTGRDRAEALAWRDHAAVAQVTGFCPANPAEAAMAAEFVAAHAQAMAVLAEAQDPATPPDWVPRCRAQAACMMRLAQGAVRALMRMQATRERRAGEQAAADWAAQHAAATARTEPAAPDQATGLSHADGLNPANQPHETIMSEVPSPTPTAAAAPASPPDSRAATHDPDVETVRQEPSAAVAPARDPGESSPLSPDMRQAQDAAHDPRVLPAPAPGAGSLLSPDMRQAQDTAHDPGVAPAPAPGAGSLLSPDMRQAQDTTNDPCIDAPALTPDGDHLPPAAPHAFGNEDGAGALTTSLPLAPPRPGLRHSPDATRPPLAA